MKTQIQIMHEAGLLTAAEVATLIGASQYSAVHRLVKAGKLVGERVLGKHWFITAESLLRANAQSPTICKRITEYCAQNGIPVATKKDKA